MATINEEVWAKSGHLLLSSEKTRKKAFDYLKRRISEGSVPEFFVFEKLLNGSSLALNHPVSRDLQQDAYDFLAENFSLVCSGALRDTNLARRIALGIIKNHVPEVLRRLSDDDLLVLYAFLVRNALAEEMKDYGFSPEKDMKDEHIQQISGRAKECLLVYGGYSLLYNVLPDISELKGLFTSKGDKVPKSFTEAKDATGIVVDMTEVVRAEKVRSVLFERIQKTLEKGDVLHWMLLTDCAAEALIFAMKDDRTVQRVFNFVRTVADGDGENPKTIAQKVQVVDVDGFIARRLIVASGEIALQLKKNFAFIRNTLDFVADFQEDDFDFCRKEL